MRKLFADKPIRAYEALSTGGGPGDCIEDDGDYSKVLGWYAEASGGVFNPTDIKDRLDWDERKAHIQFTFRGRVFKATLPFESDYIADEFDEFLNGVLRSCSVRERFFQLPSSDGFAWITFVDPRAYKKAIKNNIIPDQRDVEEEMCY